MGQRNSQNPRSERLQADYPGGKQASTCGFKEDSCKGSGKAPPKPPHSQIPTFPPDRIWTPKKSCLEILHPKAAQPSNQTHPLRFPWRFLLPPLCDTPFSSQPYFGSFSTRFLNLLRLQLHLNSGLELDTTHFPGYLINTQTGKI
jgi:hypothetical protein